VAQPARCGPGRGKHITDEGYSSERSVLILLLGLALVHGLLYICLIPPWEHYDEPTHFEYAWLIANRLSLPQVRDYDRDMRREVAGSMLEHGFYRDRDGILALLEQEKPPWIGYSELADPPVYYLSIALPLHLVRYAGVALQLYVARFVSLLLYLLTVWVGYRLVGELVLQGHPLRWAVPGAMALLPAYADLMSAVNNDAGAVAVFSLFLWGSVRTILRGLSLLRLLWVTGAAALCVWTKNTVGIAVVLLPVVLALALLRRTWKGWWIAVPATGVLLALALLNWGDAAAWYRSAAQASPTSQSVQGAPLGNRAMALEITATDAARQVYQLLSEADVKALQGRTVTLGAWVWASRPAQMRTPTLYDGQQGSTQVIQAGVGPTFYALTATVSSDATFVRVTLSPSPSSAEQDGIVVYYDGIVLAEGDRTGGGAPVFDNARGDSGLWGERSFVNRVRNGSAEVTGPYVRSWIERSLQKYARRSPSQFLASLLDWQRTGWVYRVTAARLLRSFWATFGWNQTGLSGAWYGGLAVLTALGVTGSVVSLVKLRRRHRSAFWARSVVFLAIAALALWGNAYLRPHPVTANPYLPVARYAYPAIVPTVLALAGGWWALTPRRARRWFLWGLFTVMGLLDVAAVWAVIVFFYGR
jgi:hypothetical protein